MLVTEIQKESPQILIVDKQISMATQALTDTLTASGAHVATKPTLPRDASRFDSIFFVNEMRSPTRAGPHTEQRWYFVYVGASSIASQRAKSLSGLHIEGAKVVNLPHSPTREHIENMLWFLFSKSSEKYLNLEEGGGRHVIKKRTTSRLKLLTPRMIITSTLLIIILLHLALLPLQLAAFYLLIPSPSRFAQVAVTAESVAYSAGRPTYAFFGLALMPDRMHNVLARLPGIRTAKERISQRARLVLVLSDRPLNEPSRRRFLLDALTAIKRDLQELEEDLTAVGERLPDFPSDMAARRAKFEAAAGRTRAALILTQASLKYLELGLPLPQDLLDKLQEVVTSL